MNRMLLLAALIGACAIAGVSAQDDDAKMVEGFTYLYSTDLYSKQPKDLIRTFDSLFWDNGQNPKGMHKCARLCRKEGGGGVCAAWTFCWDQRRCNLLSRLPSSLQPAKPTNPNPLANSNRTLNTYNAKCASGFSQSVASHNLLTATCKAAISQNTLLGDTLSLTATNRSRALKVDYDANQPSAAHCCALCAVFKDKGCTAWSYDPEGWLIDRSRKCTLRSGLNPTMSDAKGSTSGVMMLL